MRSLVTHGAHDLLVDADPALPVGSVPGLGPVEGLDPDRLCGDVLVAGVDLERPGDQFAGPPVTPWMLAVLAGPSAGRSVGVAASDGGEAVVVAVGGDRDAGLALDDPSVAPDHLRLRIDPDGSAAVDHLGAGAVYAADGSALAVGEVVPVGRPVRLGRSVVAVVPVPAADADVIPNGEGRLWFNRSARLAPVVTHPRLRVPSVPTATDERAPIPWAVAFVPLLIGVFGAMAMGRPEMLLFAFASPVMTVANVVTTRKQSKQREGSSWSTFTADVEELGRRVVDAGDAERARLATVAPDPATLAALVRGPSRRIWERRSHEPDSLLLRVGVGPVEVPAEIHGTEELEGWTPQAGLAPVTIELGAVDVLGVAGPARARRALAGSLVLQLAALHAPSHLQLVILAPEADEADWAWVRWLPHVAGTGDAPLAALAVSDDAATAWVKALGSQLEARLAARREDRAATFADLVVVLDGARRLREVAGMARLLAEGPSVGIRAIALDDLAAQLPEETRAEVVLGPDGASAVVRQAGRSEVGDVVAELVASELLEPAARALAPLVAVGGAGDDVALPTASRYWDVAGFSEASDPADLVLQGWARQPRSTVAVVGVGLDGPATIDLKLDGPHALVAGTTGAGKSEFLQTLVTALAVANRPDALNFVLVDYKGASAFADAERLPHTVGMVTNLDNRETERALASLDAELKRREGVLKGLAAKDVDDAWEHHPDQAATQGLARLVLVIDEFAELVHELPEFVKGLVRIARVGRSLGVHLVLATQRPAGVVNAEMQANIGLRVALRMADKENSTEVLKSGEAALISPSTPGRGYVRGGGAAAAVPFQSARVGGTHLVAGAVAAAGPASARPVGYSDLERSFDPPKAASGASSTVTDLKVLVDAVAEAARRADVPVQRRPWLPPIADRVPVTDLLEGVEEGSLQVPVGRMDLPAQQAQAPLHLDLAHGGHLIVAGAARTGRSTLLRSIALSAASLHGPSALHVYGLDFGNGGLASLGELPHCGAIVARSEVTRADRLLQRLGDEVDRRQQLLARGGYGDIGEQHLQAEPAERLPFVLVLIDRWDGFTTTFPVDTGEAARANLLRLLREGQGVGMRVVVGGDRSVLTDRVASLVEDVWVLRLADPNDYRSAGLRPAQLPEHIPAGRAYRGDPAIEVQFAMVGTDPSGTAQAAAVREAAVELAGRWPAPAPAQAPMRVETMPERIDLAEALGRAVGIEASGGSGAGAAVEVAIGVGGDGVTQVRHRLDRTRPGLLVSGPGRSGKTTALHALARQAVDGGARVVLVSAALAPALVAAGQVHAAGLDGDLEEIASFLADPGPVLIVADDVDQWAGSDLDATLSEHLAARPDTFVAASADLEGAGGGLRGLLVDTRRSKTGLVLWPQSILDGDPVGLRLPRHLLGKAPAGRAVWATSGVDPMFVQVPVVDAVGTAGGGS
jgi:S-DNA-T family DNA segregation ATPase FtsK/SpoIIIE